MRLKAARRHQKQAHFCGIENVVDTGWPKRTQTGHLKPNEDQ